MQTANPNAPAPHDAPSGHDPGRLFAGLGFGFVRRFLWIVLGACSTALGAVLLLGWSLEGDVTVHGTGLVQPSARHLIKTVVAGRIEEIRVHAGSQVEEEDVLVVLSPRNVRARLTQVEQQLDLSDARRQRLQAQMAQDGSILAAVLASRQLDVQRADFTLLQVRQEQQLYTTHARKGWRRQQLDDLVPVQQARATAKQARAQVEITLQQLAANDGRRQDLALEQRTWMQLDAERRGLWHQLENTVIRAPVAGTVLTGDLHLRVGDHVDAGEALLQLAAQGAWSARVLIPQIDRPKVRTGQRARVFVRAYPHLEFGVLQGRVSEIAAQSTDGSTYPVRVELDSAAVLLADGMAAEVRVSVDQGRLLELVWKGLMRQLGSTPLPALRMPDSQQGHS